MGMDCSHSRTHTHTHTHTHIHTPPAHPIQSSSLLESRLLWAKLIVRPNPGQGPCHIHIRSGAQQTSLSGNVLNPKPHLGGAKTITSQQGSAAGPKDSVIESRFTRDSQSVKLKIQCQQSNNLGYWFTFFHRLK